MAAVALRMSYGPSARASLPPQDDKGVGGRIAGALDDKTAGQRKPLAPQDDRLRADDCFQIILTGYWAYGIARLRGRSTGL